MNSSIPDCPQDSWRARWGFMIVATALVLVGADKVAGQSGAANEFQERLFIAEFALDRGLDSRYQQETERLLAICKVYGSVCFAQHFSEVRERIATLRSQPGPTADVVGHLVAVIRVSGEEFGGLDIGLDVETSGDPARIGTWLKSVGDWGYGIHVSGVRPRGEWLQLTHLPFVGVAWLSATEPDLTARVSPLTEEILELQSLVAIFPDGRTRAIPAGSYLVTRMVGGRIQFRAEVPTDYACGEPVEGSIVMPPMLHAEPATFFNEDGIPRFSRKYQRGC